MSSSLATGPFSSPVVIGAGYLDAVSAEVTATIQVTATLTSSGEAPREKVFAVESTSTATGLANVTGSTSNGIDSSFTHPQSNLITCTGKKYIVVPRNPSGQYLMSFKVSSYANSTPIPPPFGTVHAFANNQLVVTPDNHAVTWKFANEPSFYRVVDSNGVAYRKLYPNVNTQDREVATVPIIKPVIIGSSYVNAYVFDRLFDFYTFGFPPYPDSQNTITSSHQDCNINPLGVWLKGVIDTEALNNASFLIDP